jgi:hypothetical protein
MRRGREDRRGEEKGRVKQEKRITEEKYKRGEKINPTWLPTRCSQVCTQNRNAEDRYSDCKADTWQVTSAAWGLTFEFESKPAQIS